MLRNPQPTIPSPEEIDANLNDFYNSIQIDDIPEDFLEWSQGEAEYDQDNEDMPSISSVMADFVKEGE